MNSTRASQLKIARKRATRKRIEISIQDLHPILSKLMEPRIHSLLIHYQVDLATDKGLMKESEPRKSILNRTWYQHMVSQLEAPWVLFTLIEVEKLLLKDPSNHTNIIEDTKAKQALMMMSLMHQFSSNQKRIDFSLQKQRSTGKLTKSPKKDTMTQLI